MRIALLYPPPWKIPAPGDSPFEPGQGPPADYREGDLDADFFQTPYGLFSIGAQALRAGHQVKVLNLSGFAWQRVEEVVSALQADIFGLSCWTANRRGVALTAKAIRRAHPNAHIIIGGPHATPLAKEMLAHYPEIDSVAIGESEQTFMELVARLEASQSTQGIAGTAYRRGDQIELGPPRAAIENLDTLASPHAYFDTHIVMTSRGCPWACTFCGAETTWGRGFRGESVPYVLDALEHAISRLSVKMVQIKDDTFTANRKRALEICRGIRARKLSFLWSCDTRVDVLSEDLLREMRLAGCQRLSLGVESGSATILKNIHKKISAEEIIEAAEMAKKFGIQVRFYMMLGNRGETAETFQETLDFLNVAKPHQYIFSCLSVFPGTQDFYEAERAGWLDRNVYFSADFQELKVPFDASEADTQIMNDWFAKNKGLQDFYLEDSDRCQQILANLGEQHHAAHLDLAGAYFREKKLDLCDLHARRALDLGHPTPGLALNYLACTAALRGNIESMQDYFMQAAKRDPQHSVLVQNVQAARAWFKNNGPSRKLSLNLIGRHEFQLLERTVQPSLPGPLPENFAEWSAPLPVAPADLTHARIGSTTELASGAHSEPIATVVDRQRQPIEFRSRRLPVVT